MFGLSQKHCPPELVKIRDLFKKTFALAAYFHRGDHVQRVAAHRLCQLDIAAINAAAALFDDPPEEEDACDSFLDVDVDQSETDEACAKMYRHVVHGKTRCWSTVDSAASILHTREANSEFFALEENLADAEYNLSPAEYQAMNQIIGIATDIVDVERYVEGSAYSTGSILHPLTIYLHATLTSGSVHVLDYANPEGDRVEMETDKLCSMAKHVLDACVSEIKRVFGEEPATDEEALVIYSDPRLKSMSFYKQTNMSGELSIWRRARDMAKEHIITMIKYDRTKEREGIMSEALPVAKADATQPLPAKKFAKGSLACRIAASAAKGAAAAAAAPPTEAPNVTSPALLAESVLEAWDAYPEPEMLLLPDPETGRKPINLVHWHYDKVLRRSKISYMCLVALAFGGSPGSAASCERYFRAVAFVNDLKRCNQKPQAISDLSFLQRGSAMLASAEAMEIRYKIDLANAKKSRDQERARARARDEDADDEIDTRLRLSFEAMTAGLDEPLDDWLGFGTIGMTEVDAASDAGASGADVASAIALADDDNGGFEDEETALLAPPATPDVVQPLVAPPPAPTVVQHGIVNEAGPAGGTRAAAAACGRGWAVSLGT